MIIALSTPQFLYWSASVSQAVLSAANNINVECGQYN